MTALIYGLYSSLDADCRIRYVGYTSKALERRVVEHLSEAKKRRCRRHKWINSVIRSGGSVLGVVLEACDAANWQERERAWIERLSANDLVNGTAGGEGLINPTEDVRARISAKVSQALVGNQFRKGRPHSPEARAAIAQGVRTSEAYARAASRRRGRPGPPVSQEARAKISAAKIGIPRPDVAERLRGNTYGANVRHTDEFKAKVAERNRQSAGSRWITDGVAIARLPKDADLPTGWRFGRK